jgi:hypothetical protein
MARSHAWVAAGVLVGLVTVTAGADAAPKKPKKPGTSEAAPKDEPGADFDRQAAVSAIAEVNLQKCKATNAAKGEGHVTITFLPAGSAQTAAVDKGPWVGTPVARCMVKEFKKAKVPAFKGDAVTVGKVFHFE